MNTDDFRKMADPETLRATIRARHPNFDEKEVDDVANDEILNHSMELCDKLHKWGIEHEKLLKQQGKSNTAADIIEAMMKITISQYASCIDMSNPIKALLGARAINSMFSTLLLEAVKSLLKIKGI